MVSQFEFFGLKPSPSSWSSRAEASAALRDIEPVFWPRWRRRLHHTDSGESLPGVPRACYPPPPHCREENIMRGRRISASFAPGRGVGHAVSANAGLCSSNWANGRLAIHQLRTHRTNVRSERVRPSAFGVAAQSRYLPHAAFVGILRCRPQM
jgi:hypothetical protein